MSKVALRVYDINYMDIKVSLRLALIHFSCISIRKTYDADISKSAKIAQADCNLFTKIDTNSCEDMSLQPYGLPY